MIKRAGRKPIVSLSPKHMQKKSGRKYELARKTFVDGDVWGVDYITDGTSHEFWVWAGVGHGAGGTHCSTKELLSDKWENHLRLCGALWLVPLLERFAAGEAITKETVLNAYEQQYGHPAPGVNL